MARILAFFLVIELGPLTGFTAPIVTRTVTLTSDAAGTEAVVLANHGVTATQFELTHNGHAAFTSMAEILQYVDDLPDEISGEPFERKLWRFVRGNSYHFPPVGDDPWLLAAWPTLDSFGWGFCSNVAVTYVQIARAAGYEARVWGLEGHVVPEIRIDGAWHMYDPDLAVYYKKPDGTVAGVQDLVANPALVSSPISPIFDPGENDWAYSQTVADIYGSTADNYIYPDSYLPSDPFPDAHVVLPVGGRLIYPGQWTPAPVGYDSDGTPYVVPQFRQARLELPPGFSGVISVPWVLWDIQGTGRVQILGQDFLVGSTELRDFLARTGVPVTEIEVIDNPSGLALIMMINPLWYDMRANNEIGLTGEDVSAIEVATYPLDPANRPPPPVPADLIKPRSCEWINGYSGCMDTDNDEVVDTLDNCVNEPNPDQLDSDQDGYGNACDADLNQSGRVTVADYMILVSRLNTTDADADLNGSGRVTTADYVIMRSLLNKRPGPSGLRP